ncbi:hypothetical protein DC366_05510 [Pelagivirga sediminicola]|uniref:Phage holin family protein n=1 Tax=Pelagivirga sediminicola TaxID=2170575 RepID=A0A2T7G9W8_9RHOB|nr:phage holin family protein [Pelagivirga sediminicola]PVA11213.1 hypothetical protein DC366_05510 [Pelagivirga sediminicola]
MGLIDALKYRSARAIRRALMCGVGGLMVAIGIGFLTAAGWILLEQVYSAAVAALVLAGIYAGIGLIILGMAASSARRERFSPEAAPLREPAKPPQPGAMPPLAEAFIIGLNAALAARGRR